MSLVIKKLEKTAIPSLLKIADQCFGNGFFTIEQTELLVQKQTPLFVLLKNKILIGFVFAHSDSTPFSAYLDRQKKQIGILQSIAVLPSLQNKGMGKLLLNHILEYFKLKNYQSVIYPAWKENNPHFIKHLKKIGFKKIKEIKNYWKKDSLEKNYTCKRCGNPPCLCTLSIYLLQF